MTYSIESCTLAEYNSQRDQRVDETTIDEVSIYTAMVRLKSKKYDALTFPVAIEKAPARPAGIYIISLCMLTAKLESMLTTNGSMHNGIWTPAKDDPFEFGYPINGKVNEGYLVDFVSDADLDTLFEEEVMTNPLDATNRHLQHTS